MNIQGSSSNKPNSSDNSSMLSGTPSIRIPIRSRKPSNDFHPSNPTAVAESPLHTHMRGRKKDRVSSIERRQTEPSPELSSFEEDDLSPSLGRRRTTPLPETNDIFSFDEIDPSNLVPPPSPALGRRPIKDLSPRGDDDMFSFEQEDSSNLMPPPSPALGKRQFKALPEESEDAFSVLSNEDSSSSLAPPPSPQLSKKKPASLSEEIDDDGMFRLDEEISGSWDSPVISEGQGLFTVPLQRFPTIRPEQRLGLSLLSYNNDHFEDVFEDEDMTPKASPTLTSAIPELFKNPIYEKGIENSIAVSFDLDKTLIHDYKSLYDQKNLILIPEASGMSEISLERLHATFIGIRDTEGTDAHIKKLYSKVAEAIETPEKRSIIFDSFIKNNAENNPSFHDFFDHVSKVICESVSNDPKLSQLKKDLQTASEKLFELNPAVQSLVLNGIVLDHTEALLKQTDALGTLVAPTPQSALGIVKTIITNSGQTRGENMVNGQNTIYALVAYENDAGKTAYRLEETDVLKRHFKPEHIYGCRTRWNPDRNDHDRFGDEKPNRVLEDFMRYNPNSQQKEMGIVMPFRPEHPKFAFRLHIGDSIADAQFADTVAREMAQKVYSILLHYKDQKIPNLKEDFNSWAAKHYNIDADTKSSFYPHANGECHIKVVNAEDSPALMTKIATSIANQIADHKVNFSADPHPEQSTLKNLQDGKFSIWGEHYRPIR